MADQELVNPLQAVVWSDHIWKLLSIPVGHELYARHGIKFPISSQLATNLKERGPVYVI